MRNVIEVCVNCGFEWTAADYRRGCCTECGCDDHESAYADDLADMRTGGQDEEVLR